MITNRDKFHMNTLILSLEPRELVANHRVGALIVLKRTIIAFGYNSYKTHPLQLKYGRNAESVHLHAEIFSIVNALHRISVSDLAQAYMYVARIRKDRSIGLARPCNGCLRAIENFNLKRVLYTSNNGDIKELQK